MRAFQDRRATESRKRLLAAGWQPTVRGGLLGWHRPDGRGSWYSQGVALEVLEVFEGGSSSSGEREQGASPAVVEELREEQEKSTQEEARKEEILYNS